MNSLSSVFFYDQEVQATDFTSELIDGFRASQKSISPKFFYDETGSKLFTEITRQPEYYLTRTEVALLQDHASAIGELIGDDSLLIEYGSGSSEKIRILLDNLKPSIYAPLDISREYLADAAEALGKEYPWLEVHATCVDFTKEFKLPFKSEQRRVSFFPGSSIGNFQRDEASIFIKRIRQLVGADGGLLIGVDLKKDVETLNAAYNDAAGVTAEFNLNVLEHLNRDYDANFDLSAFRHSAGFDPSKGCIEMFLVSQKHQYIQLCGEQFEFQENEAIHTENSHKYGTEEIIAMAREAGFNRVEYWCDENEFFGVFYFYSDPS